MISVPDKRAGGDERGFYIRTFTGKKFYWEDIENNVYDIRDIAHALAMNCRWTGHVKSFYSVAQHCVYATYEAPTELKLAALLHDASEAYVHDTPSPLKWYLQQHDFTAFKDLESRVDRSIYAAFSVQWPRPKEIKEIDLRLLATENRDLMPAGEERIHMIEPYEWTVKPLLPEAAEKLYLKTFHQLWNKDTGHGKRQRAA